MVVVLTIIITNSKTFQFQFFYSTVFESLCYQEGRYINAMSTKVRMSCTLLSILILSLLHTTVCFREWNYSITQNNLFPTWKETWKLISPEDEPSAPRPRRGHSIVVAGTRLLLFGGRGNEADAVHIPKTYNVEKVTKHREYIKKKCDVHLCVLR